MRAGNTAAVDEGFDPGRQEHSAAGGLIVRVATVVLFCVVVALLNWSTTDALIHLSRNDATASHLILVPFVSVALIFQERDRVFASVRTDWAAGLVLAAVGLALLVLDRRSAEPSLTVALTGIVLLWVAAFVAAFGRVAGRAALFPLVFLGFTIPIPAVVLDAAVRFLKHASTEMVDALFTLTGTTYHREGFVFTLPSVSIEIADECSGIRSSIALLLTTLLAGHAFLRTGWKKAVLVAAIVPLTILKNGIRIVGLTLLAVHVNPSFLTGQLHHEGGIVFFLMALLMLEPLFYLLRTSEPDVRRTAT
jgi:exosortase